MEIKVGNERVVMSGVVVARVGDQVSITADDGTELRLEWNGSGTSSRTGGSDDMRLLTGSFPASKPPFPSVSAWGVGEVATGKQVNIRIFADRPFEGDIVCSFTVTANF